MTVENHPAMRRAAVVCNPVKVELRLLRAAVEAEERRRDWAQTLWFETTRDDSGGEAARRALEKHPDVLIVVGGDGTVRAVAEAAHDSGVALALVPSGTGNLLARNLGLPLNDIGAAVRTAFAENERRVDIAFAEFERDDGSVSSHAFLVMAGIGLDASMAVNTNSALKKRIGWLAYANPIARSVVRNRQLPMRYTVDGAPERSVRAHTVIVGNCGTLTANILLLPDAIVDDGLLDVVVLRPKGFVGWARIGSRLALNGPLQKTRVGRSMLRIAPTIRALQYIQARELGVRFATAESIELDGDTFGMVTAAKISVRRRGLRIRVPAGLDRRE